MENSQKCVRSSSTQIVFLEVFLDFFAFRSTSKFNTEAYIEHR